MLFGSHLKYFSGDFKSYWGTYVMPMLDLSNISLMLKSGNILKIMPFKDHAFMLYERNTQIFWCYRWSLDRDTNKE